MRRLWQVLALALASCSGPTLSFAQSLVPSTHAHRLYVGDTARTTATVTGATGVIAGAALTFSGTASTVFTAHTDGRITARSVGCGWQNVSYGSWSRARVEVCVVAAPAPDSGPTSASSIDPGAGDVVVYDDDFRAFPTLEARRARRLALVAGTAPFYFFDGPDAGTYREALDSIVAPGFGGSPFAYRVRVDFAREVEPSMYAQVFHRSGRAWHFAPDAATLVVDLWIRSTLRPDETLWVKGLMMGHSYDRTQFGWNTFSASLGWANVLPQSNGMDVYQRLEDGAPDAPVRFRRWSDVHDGQWHRHTMVFRRSSGTGTARDGLARYYVDGEKLVDASAEGLAAGWMRDRVSGVSASSTTPYPGNVGEKYSSVTAEAALRGLSDDPVTSLIFPGILRGYGARGGGTVDVGRVRIWYREAGR